MFNYEISCLIKTDNFFKKCRLHNEDLINWKTKFNPELKAKFSDLDLVIFSWVYLKWWNGNWENFIGERADQSSIVTPKDDCPRDAHSKEKNTTCV